MKTRVIKTERVQKMVIKEIVSRLQYVADMFVDYSVYVENEDKSCRFVMFADNRKKAVNSFITSTVIKTIDERLADIIAKYPGVYWLVDTRYDLSDKGDEYTKAVVEVHAPIEQGK